MEQRIIDAVAAAGFDVWMRDTKDTWAERARGIHNDG
jgi:3-hydroxyacyl-CoA dehydrogenase